MSEKEKAMRVRVKLGDTEVEVEGSKEDVGEFLSSIPDILARLSMSRESNTASKTNEQMHQQSAQQQLPELTFGKGESLPSIILKLFSSGWGRQPRKLLEVKDSLETFGLIYPKQSVAVALLRLAKEGKLRRFKQPDGEFVYTLPTSLLSQEFKPEVLQVGEAEVS
ncbi:MAG: hypothetical protein QXX17_01695 [Conexivisphaerales archaeon]